MVFSNIKEYIIHFKSEYTYVAAIIISIAIIMWFRGIIGLIDHFIIRKNKLYGCCLLVALSIIILFIMGDGLDPVFDVRQRQIINTIKEKHNNNNNNNKYDNNDNNDFTLLSPSSHRDLYF